MRTCCHMLLPCASFKAASCLFNAHHIKEADSASSSTYNPEGPDEQRRCSDRGVARILKDAGQAASGARRTGDCLPYLLASTRADSRAAGGLRLSSCSLPSVELTSEFGTRAWVVVAAFLWLAAVGHGFYPEEHRVEAELQGCCCIS